LGLRIVAEGVETKEDWDFLLGLDSDLRVQGYYIAKPMAPKAFVIWQKDWCKRNPSKPK